MKNLITLALFTLVVLFAAVFVSCKDAKNIEYTGKTLATLSDEELAEIKKDLTEPEKKQLMRHAMRQIFTKEANPPTIGAALEEQQTYEDRAKEQKANKERAQLEEQARAEERKAELKKRFNIEVLSKQPHKQDYQDYTLIKMRFSNYGKKDIRAVEFTVTFDDLFGDRLTHITCKEATPIDAQKALTTNYSFKCSKYNKEQKVLYDLSLTNSKATWDIKTIIYADGTKEEFE